MNEISIYEHDKSENTELFSPYHIDCQACSGLCCVALFFSKTDGFPDNKAAGTPCKNLMSNFRCSIHSNLLQKKMKGCLSYDCMGAGQITTQKFCWQEVSNLEKEQIFKAFLNTCRLQHILFYLTQAMVLQPAKSIKDKLNEQIGRGRAIYTKDLDDFLKVDIETYQLQSNSLLKEVSNKILLSYGKDTAIQKQINYMGVNLKGKNLIGNDFSTSYLIAANLEGANLYAANFLGADMRDANIRNTDLRDSIFLTQSQINSALGNQNTKLPSFLIMPLSWT